VRDLSDQFAADDVLIGFPEAAMLAGISESEIHRLAASGEIETAGRATWLSEVQRIALARLEDTDGGR
jgi:hypothetical protein